MGRVVKGPLRVGFRMLHGARRSSRRKLSLTPFDVIIIDRLVLRNLLWYRLPWSVTCIIINPIILAWRGIAHHPEIIEPTQ